MDIFSNGNLIAAYPMLTKNDADCTTALLHCTKDIGIPFHLKTHMVTAFIGWHTEFRIVIQKFHIFLTHLEPY